MLRDAYFVIATAGHVDHGKTALVQALTGTDTDRLPEEKARGLTIDLGFAALELTTPDVALRIGIVDVPGHEDFVKNMVAGVGSIDLALFIVAADDGWMPQTEEHLQILSYVGVRDAIVAVTKADLADAETLELVIEDVREHLKHTPFADAPIVTTSSQADSGIDDLRQALAGVLAACPAPADFGKPRLSVDRVFTIDGAGTIVTGTLAGGILSAGAAVVVQPGGCRTRVRTLQTHNAQVDTIVPGMRAALNLADATAHVDVSRGDVVTVSGTGEAAATIDVQLEMSARLQARSNRAHVLKDETRVNLHHGAGHVPATVQLLDSRGLKPGERALAQLRLEAPVFLFAGDRFVIRDWPERVTLAGGIVLDPDAQRGRLRSENRRNFLTSRVAALHDTAACLRGLLQRDSILQIDSALQKSRFSRVQIDSAVEVLAAAGELERLESVAIAAVVWQAAGAAVAAAVDACHREFPERAGPELTELSSQVAEVLRAPDLFRSLVVSLCDRGFVQVGNVLRRAAHVSELPEALARASEKIRETLDEKPFEPPARKELLQLPKAPEIVRFMIESGDAVQIGPELVMSGTAYAEAIVRVRAHIEANGPATVSDLKSAIGTTRRVMVPLAEKMDRDRVTVRVGDKRKIM